MLFALSQVPLGKKLTILNAGASKWISPKRVIQTRNRPKGKGRLVCPTFYRRETPPSLEEKYISRSETSEWTGRKGARFKKEG